MNQHQLLQLRAQLKIAAQLNTCTTTNTREIDNSSGISSSTLESVFQSNPMHTMNFWKSCPEAPHHNYIKCPVGDFEHHQIPMALLAQERDNYIQMKMQTQLRRLSTAFKSTKLTKEDEEKYKYITHMLYLNSRQKYVRDTFYNSYTAYSSGNPLKKKDISAIIRMKPLSQQEKKKKYVIRGISYNDFLWPTGTEFTPETPFTPLPRYVIRDRQKDNPDIDLKQTLPVVKSVLSASASLFVANHAYDFFTAMRTNYQATHMITQELNKLSIKNETKEQEQLLSDLFRSKLSSLADVEDESFHKFWKPPNFTHGIRIYPQPTNLDPSVEMHKYQIEGMSWLIHLYDHHVNAILADETGLGKTLEIISFLAFLNEQRHISGPHLIVMPNSVLETWEDEFRKRYPETVTILYTFKRKRRYNVFEKTIKRGDFDILITSYTILMKDKDLLRTISWRVVVLDEAHMLKNQRTEIFKAVDELFSDFRILSTATPFQNDIKELWSILYLIAPHEFCSLDIFTAFFKDLESNNPDEQRDRILSRLHEIVRPYILRRKKNDIDFNIPDKFEVTLKNSPSDIQKRIIEKTLEFDLSTSQKIFISRKVSNSPVLFLEKSRFKSIPPNYILLRSPKMRILDQILKKLIYTDHKFLIYSQWTTTMNMIENVLNYRNIIFSRIDGSVQVKYRIKIIQDFVKPNSDIQGMLLSTRSSAFGLNLQVADTVILFDSDYNPFVELQASDRVHRLGQVNVVVIIRLLMVETGEEKILRVSRKKYNLGRQIIDAGKFKFNSNNENDNENDDKNDGDTESQLTSSPPDILDPNDEELDGVIARSDGELAILQSSKSIEIPDSPEYSDLDNEIMERINKKKFEFQSSESEYEEWEDVEFD